MSTKYFLFNSYFLNDLLIYFTLYLIYIFKFLIKGVQLQLQLRTGTGYNYIGQSTQSRTSQLKPTRTIRLLSSGFIIMIQGHPRYPILLN